MDLEQLQKEAEKDLKIDKEQLDIESLKTPELLGQMVFLDTPLGLIYQSSIPICVLEVFYILRLLVLITSSNE